MVRLRLATPDPVRPAGVPATRMALPFPLLVAMLTLLWVAAGLVPDPARGQTPPAAPHSAPPADTAAEHIRLTAVPMLTGGSRPDRWAAVRVRVENDGPTLDGELRITTLDKHPSTYGVTVELPTGARQEHILYVRAAFFGRFRVQLADGDAIVAITDAAFRPVEDATLVVALVAERPERLVEDVRAAFAASGGPAIDLGAVTPEGLPPRVQAWTAVDLIVWQDVSALSLSTDQVDALRTWVTQGGDVIVLGGSMGLAGFEGLPVDLLPFRPGHVRDVPAASLADLIGVVPLGTAPLPALAGPPGRGGVLMQVAEDAIAGRLTIGQGTVTLMGVDPATPALRGSPAAAIWAQALPPRVQGGSPDGAGRERSLGASLSTLPTVSVPRQDHLLLLLAGYLLLLGPVSYLVLRRLDRLAWAWVTMPVLIGVFAVAAFVLGVVLKGSSVVVRELAVVTGAGGVELGVAEVQVSVFSPNRATFDVRLPEGGLISMPAGRRKSGAPPLDVLVSPSEVRGLRVDSGAQRTFRAETTLPVPRVETALVLVDGRMQGTVTNASGVLLEDVVVLHGGGVQVLGDLVPGAVGQVDVSTTGKKLERRALARRMFPRRPDADAVAQLLRASRMALLRYVSTLPGWRDPSLGADTGGRALILVWRQGGILEVDVGPPSRIVGDAVYMLLAPLTVSGPVTLTGTTIRPALVGITAVTGTVQATSMRMTRGTLTVVFRPSGFDGTLAVTAFSLRLASIRGVAGEADTDLVPLPEDQQPSAADPTGTGPPPATGVGTGRELPQLQLYDRVSGGWIEFQPLDGARTYRVPAPERYVDAWGGFQARFIVRTGDGPVSFALEPRLEGIAS